MRSINFSNMKFDMLANNFSEFGQALNAEFNDKKMMMNQGVQISGFFS